jgi:hypothetical protein
VLTPQFGHLPDLIVGEQHDAAPLGDAMDLNAKLLAGPYDSPHSGRALDAGDFHPILRSIGEPLGRSGKMVSITLRKPQVI